MSIRRLLLPFAAGLFSTLVLGGCNSTQPEWNPGPWTKAESPVDTPWITAVGANGTRLFVGTNHAFFASEGGGFSKPLGSPRMGLVWRIEVSGEVVVVDGSRYLSRDGGATWTEFRTPPPFGPQGEVIGTVRRVTPAGPNLFAYATQGNFVSRDWGATWLPLALTDTPLVVAGQGSAQVLCTQSGCSVSSDGGRTSRPSDLAPKPMAYSLRTLDNLWILWGESIPGTLLLSEDSGSTWSPSPRHFNSIEALALTPAGRLFVVNLDAGLHTSADRGKTWVPVQEPASTGDNPFGIKSVGYWNHAVWLGTTQGLWRFQAQ